jgi:beta-lactam-binding protein with PASTA domain
LDEPRTNATVLRRLLLLALLGLTFVASAMVTIYVLFQAGEVQVPNIVGMSQEEAQRAIERAGLHFKLRRQHFDPATPTGQVTVQDPAAGFPVKEGYDIKVDVSKGPDPTGKDAEPPPPGPTNPVDGPTTEKKKKDDKKKKEDEKKGEDAKPVLKVDEPGAVKPGDAEKPKPKPAETKPKPADAKTDAPPKPTKKPATTKVPPS